MAAFDIDPQLQAVIERTAEAVANHILVSQREAAGIHRLLTFQQATQYLNCSPATLRRWQKARQLIPHRFGRRILFARDDLDVHIARAR